MEKNYYNQIESGVTSPSISIKNEKVEPRVNISYRPSNTTKNYPPPNAVVKSHYINVSIEELDDSSYVVERREEFEYELNGKYDSCSHTSRTYSEVKPNDVYLKAITSAIS